MRRRSYKQTKTVLIAFTCFVCAQRINDKLFRASKVNTHSGAEYLHDVLMSNVSANRVSHVLSHCQTDIETCKNGAGTSYRAHSPPQTQDNTTLDL